MSQPSAAHARAAPAALLDVPAQFAGRSSRERSAQGIADWGPAVAPHSVPRPAAHAPASRQRAQTSTSLCPSNTELPLRPARDAA